MASKSRPDRRGSPSPAGPGLLSDTAYALWPDAHAIRLTRAPRLPAGCQDWLVLPSVSRPRWLLPPAEPATAASLSGGESRTRRRIVELVAGAQRAGLIHRLPMRRLRVEGSGSADRPSLESVVRQLLESNDAALAIRLGSWQHARSVVLRVFAGDGSTLAFGKVGIDDLGRASVLDEALALSRVAEFGLTHIVYPKVIGRAGWQDSNLLLVSPLLSAGGHGSDALPAAAMLELAGTAGSRVGPLTSSGWWDRQPGRVAAVTDGSARERLRFHLADLERAARGAVVPLGPAHGDWTPWNMTQGSSRVLLWDWEHFAEDVPAGFDVIHFLAQQLRVTKGTAPEVETRWLEQAHVALHQHVGLGSAARDLVCAAYLLDVNLRYLLDRQSTVQTDERREGWGLELLDKSVRSLSRSHG